MSIIRVGVGVLVCRGDKVLLGKRLGSHGAGTWQPPGGHLRLGETWQGCARREVKEEAGLELMDEPSYLATSNDIFSKDLHYVTIMMQVRSFSGLPMVCEPEKCAGWQWVSWDDLPTPLFLPLEQFKKSQPKPSYLGQVSSEIIDFFNQYRESFISKDGMLLRRLFSDTVMFSTEEGELKLEGDSVYMNLAQVLDTYKRFGLQGVDFEITNVHPLPDGKTKVGLRWFFEWPKKDQVFACTYMLKDFTDSPQQKWKISAVANFSASL